MARLIQATAAKVPRRGEKNQPKTNKMRRSNVDSDLWLGHAIALQIVVQLQIKAGDFC